MRAEEGGRTAARNADRTKFMITNGTTPQRTEIRMGVLAAPLAEAEFGTDKASPTPMMDERSGTGAVIARCTLGRLIWEHTWITMATGYRSATSSDPRIRGAARLERRAPSCLETMGAVANAWKHRGPRIRGLLGIREGCRRWVAMGRWSREAIRRKRPSGDYQANVLVAHGRCTTLA